MLKELDIDISLDPLHFQSQNIQDPHLSMYLVVAYPFVHVKL